ncbi:MAG: thermonuclease family protein [Planctomycetota bacterium]
MNRRPASRRSWQSPSPSGTAIIIFIVLALLRVLVFRPELDRGTAELVQATVRYVIDGDTLDLDDGRRVRLLGIDAPEMGFDGGTAEPFAQKSTDWLKDRVEGRRVQLRIDSPKLDRYQRTLAWVFDDQGRLVNRDILLDGYARLLDSFGLPQDLEPSLREAESEARIRRVGLWQPKQQGRSQ